MSEHLDEGVLQALLDNELRNGVEAATREHLAACPICRAQYVEVKDANDSLASALALLDPPLPQAPAKMRPRPPSMARRGNWGRFELTRAAAMLLVFAAAASAAIPGSPFRAWLASTLESGEVASAGESEAIVPGPASAAAAAAPAETGVSVDLANGSFEVILTEAAPELQIRALLIEGVRGAVYARGDAVDARFSTARGTIRLDGIAGGELRVEIPRSADAASVVIEGRTYLIKDANQLRLIPADESAPTEVRFEVRQ